MEGFENFIGFNPWTALLIFCNFILTFLILKKFLYKPVQKMIDDRQKEIDDLYAEGEAKRQEAEELHAFTHPTWGTVGGLGPREG